MGHYKPSGRGPELISVFVFFMILSTSITILRVYVRKFVIKCFGWDDWLSVLGWFLFIVHGGFAIAGAYHGTGQHANLIPPSDIPIALKWWWVCEPLYVASNMAVKLSIALMLLRFIMEESQKLVVYAIVGILEVYSVAFFFIFIFQCTPPSVFWTRVEGKTGKCMDPNTVILCVYVYSAITCICDWTMALLPWILVRNLQMNKRTKLMVAFVLGLGSIASMATIVRIPYIHTLANTGDFLYSTTDVAIWSCSETGLSIIASSAATLKPLLKGALAKGRSFSSRTLSLPQETARGEWAGLKLSRNGYIRSTSAPRSLENGKLQDGGSIVRSSEISLEIDTRS